MTSNPAADVVLDLVKAQHENLTAMLDQVKEANEAQRKAAKASLERFLEAHEAAEDAYLEQSERRLDNMESWAQRLHNIDPMSSNFMKQFTDFQRDLVNHTRTEINHTFPKRLQEMTASQLALARAAFERVARTAEPMDT